MKLFFRCQAAPTSIAKARSLVLAPARGEAAARPTLPRAGLAPFAT